MTTGRGSIGLGPEGFLYAESSVHERSDSKWIGRDSVGDGADSTNGRREDVQVNERNRNNEMVRIRDRTNGS
jgi:hypothetical protein